MYEFKLHLRSGQTLLFQNQREKTKEKALKELKEIMRSNVLSSEKELVYLGTKDEPIYFVSTDLVAFSCEYSEPTDVIETVTKNEEATHQ